MVGILLLIEERVQFIGGSQLRSIEEIRILLLCSLQQNLITLDV